MSLCLTHPTYDYTAGDANGSDEFNGLDVTYSLNYFKGIGEAPPDTCDCPPNGFLFAAADANGDCLYNGLDIVYSVNSLKQTGPPPTCCCNCPPEGGPSFYDNSLQTRNNKSNLTSKVVVDITNSESNILIDVYLQSESEISFICLPIAYEWNNAIPSEVVAGPALSDWDVVWSEIYEDPNYVLLLAWNDMGGENNDPLKTDSDHALIYQITLPNEDGLKASDIIITPTIDPRNGGMILGLTDGRTTIEPDFEAGININHISNSHKREAPTNFSIIQNYPNPFNAQTSIKYTLIEQSNVMIHIYDLLGRKIETIMEGIKSTGEHQAIWQSKDQPSGIYFYRIQAGDYTEAKKMVLLR